MYIFGYGSLINAASRQRTGQTGRAVPAIAHGFQRSWGKVDGSYQLSPLVVSPGDGSCNGVVIEVPDQELVEFDRRERGYHRVEVSLDQLELTDTLSLKRPVWIYIKNDAEDPCVNHPIMQTYVDTVMAGCLSISDAFAQHFVDNTFGWHHPLKNDRHEPKYGNLAGVTDNHRGEIDRLLGLAIKR